MERGAKPVFVAIFLPFLACGQTAQIAIKSKVNPKDGLTYVWIAPGTFTMGCSAGDDECYSDEKPARPVTIAKGFWIGQTPVTQEAWQRVTDTHPSHFQSAKLPVESVNWNQARSYCQVVGMRLPTEAEWEYAARAGSTGSRYGDLDRIAWYAGNSGGRTHEVARKQPNAWGLYDMLGNVWQWTADWYANRYPAGGETDPRGPSSGQDRTMRGGYWGDNARVLRVSSRNEDEPDTSDNTVSFGLRCVSAIL